MKKTLLAILILLAWGIKGFAQEYSPKDSLHIWETRAAKKDIAATVQLYQYYADLISSGEDEIVKQFIKYTYMLDELDDEYILLETFIAIPYMVAVTCLEDSPYAKKDIEKGMRYLLFAADHGNTNAQYMLGDIYYYGQYEQKKDWKESTKWYLVASEFGHSTAMLKLGWAYQNGDGIAKNHEEALRWFTKSAELGNNYSAYYLFQCYYDGLDGFYKDMTKARYWLRKAVELGNEDAIQFQKEHNF